MQPKHGPGTPSDFNVQFAFFFFESIFYLDIYMLYACLLQTPPPPSRIPLTRFVPLPKNGVCAAHLREPDG